MLAAPEPTLANHARRPDQHPSESVTAAALEVRGLTKRFGDQPALDGLSFSVNAGERLFVVGPSGCGKTTLLRLIAGLERPDAGEVWLDGRCASGSRVHVSPGARGLSLVFQSFALWPHMTVRQHLTYVAGRHADPDRKSTRLNSSH